MRNSIRSIKINKYNLLINFTFFLIILYAIQDFQSSSNIGLKGSNRTDVYICLFLLLSVLGSNYILMFLKNNTKITNVESILWCITVWIIIVNILSKTSIWKAFVHIGISLLWLLVYAFFYNQVKSKPEIYDKVKKFMIMMFLFYVGAALYAKFNIQQLYNRTAVINYVYYIIVFFPWIMLINKGKVKKLCILLAVFIVLISMKRGALIIFPCMIFIFYWLDGKVNNRRIKNIITMSVVLILVIAGVLYIDQLYGGFISSRFTYAALTSGSGRNEIYSMVINNLLERNFSTAVIGQGSGSTLLYIGAAAHNDWLEFIFSFGIAGIILHMLLYIAFLVNTYKATRKKSIYTPHYAISILYMLVIGMIGMIYFAHSTLYLMILFGTLNGLEANNYNEMGG